jgi:predicted NUDIX family NTP pyrophosphohydrolase
MMKRRSAGLLMYRVRSGNVEVFLVHPGGPFWAQKDAGAWTVPKGEYSAEEEAFAAAQREFHEETSFVAEGPFLALGEIQQKGGKIVIAWAFEGDCNPSDLQSNTCVIEWPPRSKREMVIPEVDRGDWFTEDEARERIREEQRTFLSRLNELVAGRQA